MNALQAAVAGFREAAILPQLWPETLELVAESSDIEPEAIGPNTLILPRPSGRRSWVLDVLACSDALLSLHSCAAALLWIADDYRAVHVSHNLLREMFGLTRAEPKLARSIAIGHSLARAAATFGISEGHARQRSKAIFRKTDTSGQIELIALLTTLS